MFLAILLSSDFLVFNFPSAVQNICFIYSCSSDRIVLLSSLQFFCCQSTLKTDLSCAVVVALRMFIPKRANFPHKGSRAEINQIYRTFLTILSLFFSQSFLIRLLVS